MLVINGDNLVNLNNKVYLTNGMSIYDIKNGIITIKSQNKFPFT